MRILSAASLAAVLSFGLAQAGFAADLATKAPIYKAPPAPIATWTGCYIGGNVGYGWAPTKWSDPTFGQFASMTADGVVAGGQVGCDYQLNQQWVLGIRGMFDDGLKGSSPNSFSYDDQLIDTTKVPWFATVVGRLGFLIDPTTLFYAQGGGAWVHDNLTECCQVLIFDDGYAHTTFGGWTVGAGIEHKFTQNISAFIEYDYIGLGTNNVTFTGINQSAGTTFNYNINQNVNLVLAGLNLRFNGWH